MIVVRSLEIVSKIDVLASAGGVNVAFVSMTFVRFLIDSSILFRLWAFWILPEIMLSFVSWTPSLIAFKTFE
ncbi:hypothetical protein D1872_332570 [compost metagenome]